MFSNLLKTFLVSSILLSQSAMAASVTTVNSLNKTGGTTANTVRIERCADGSLAVANDEDELIHQGSLSPCTANIAQSNGKIANIGKKESINFSLASNSAYIGLNSIGTGFHVMYTAGNEKVTAEEREYVGNIHKCLMMIKSKVANQMFIRVSNKVINCDSM